MKWVKDKSGDISIKCLLISILSPLFDNCLLPIIIYNLILNSFIKQKSQRPAAELLNVVTVTVLNTVSRKLFRYKWIYFWLNQDKVQNQFKYKKFNAFLSYKVNKQLCMKYNSVLFLTLNENMKKYEIYLFFCFINDTYFLVRFSMWLCGKHNHSPLILIAFENSFL